MMFLILIYNVPGYWAPFPSEMQTPTQKVIAQLNVNKLRKENLPAGLVQSTSCCHSYPWESEHSRPIQGPCVCVCLHKRTHL